MNSNHLRHAIRRIIRESLLLEAPCPKCGNKNAYVGFSSVECPTKGCQFYSPRQAADVKTTQPPPTTKYDLPWYAESDGRMIHPTRKFMEPEEARDLAKKLGLSGKAADYIASEFSTAWDSIESYDSDAGAAVGSAGRINTDKIEQWSQGRAYDGGTSKYPWDMYAPNPDSAAMDTDGLTQQDIFDIEAVSDHFFESTPVEYDEDKWHEVLDAADAANVEEEVEEEEEEEEDDDPGSPFNTVARRP